MASAGQKQGRSTSTPVIPNITVDNDTALQPDATFTPTTTTAPGRRRHTKSASPSGSKNSSPEEAPGNIRGRVRMRQGAASVTDIAPRYSRIGQELRQTVPHSLSCSVFCGGVRCKYESGASWSASEQALKGVFSHWVSKNIIAMARPNTLTLKEYDLIGQFKRQGITSLINLQERNEHASCGHGLEACGYSYDPQVFMAANINCFQFGWKDFGTPPQRIILDMVKVMDHAVADGKVAVHCHAGLGRTGMLIACYLIYGEGMPADQAITLVRRRRPGSIQTKGQIETVQTFGDYIRQLRTVFSCCAPNNSPRYTVSEHLANEQLLLHGMEARKKRTVPKIVVQICKQLEQGLASSCRRASQTPSSHQATASSTTSEIRRLSFSPADKELRASSSTSSLPEISPKASPVIVHRPGSFSDGVRRPSRSRLSQQQSAKMSSSSLSASPMLSTPVGFKRTKSRSLTQPTSLATPVQHDGIRLPSISLAQSSSNIPAMISPMVSTGRSRPMSVSSDQLNLLPDYERNELLARHSSHPPAVPAVPAVPPGCRQSPTVPGLTPSKSSTSLDLPRNRGSTVTAAPRGHERELSTPTTRHSYPPVYLLHVMSGERTLERNSYERALAIMQAVNENRHWSMLENESNPLVLWTLLLQWLFGLKEPVISCSHSEEGSTEPRTPKEIDRSPSLPVGDNEVLVRHLVRLVAKVLAVATGSQADSMKNTALKYLASVLSHVSSANVEQQRTLRQIDINVDATTQQVKNLLSSLIPDVAT